MARIRFLSDQIFETDGPGKGPKFAAGFVLDETDVAKHLGMAAMPEGYAEGFLNRWLQRGVAEPIDGRTPATEVATPEVEDGEPIDLEKMTRAELDALAAEREVDISDCKNKGDVIAALELAAEV